LLLDLQNEGKSNRFVDKRLGESNPNLSKEDKAFLRYQKEAEKRAKKNIFTLDDDDVTLTHKGKSLDKIEDFEEVVPESDDDEGKIDEAQVDQLHFGGFESNNNSDGRKKTRQEIMQEIIAKSKMHKVIIFVLFPRSDILKRWKEQKKRRRVYSFSLNLMKISTQSKICLCPLVEKKKMKKLKYSEN
jgi:hypothetical protein